MNTTVNQPREGMMATVRNRRAVIARVKPFDTRERRLHLVDLEYTDTEGPPTDSVIWEREIGAKAHEPGALPDVHASLPMTPSRTFDALVRASRWSALTPFLPADGSEGVAELPVASPFHGAVQVEDFQLVPLLKALQMPRISLLLADDVGLGKTVEAGLILSELLLRRRIRRVLVLTPAALRDQWHQEMLEKFSLGFDVVDRQETYKLRKRLGLDANPWRTFPRIITSYHYLRQEDVLREFDAACKQPEGTAQLPWDLLIVDEAHNLMPASFGDDSDLTKMLRWLSPLFEHKLFLTATPHNGHTRSFSGLLELLDPVRFNRTSEFTEAEKERIGHVVVRRLKREINESDREEIEKSNDTKRRPRFCERLLEPVPLYPAPRERALSEAFSEFRSEVHSLIAARRSRSEQVAGAFAVEVLNKRLLSSPVTFADSWLRFLDGLNADEQAETSELEAARSSSEEDIDDDLEKEGRGRHASRTAGAWLKPLADKLEPHLQKVSSALDSLGIRRDGDHLSVPREDARFERLLKLIDGKLRAGKHWRNDERLILFTEYKTTLDDLERRLREHYGDEPEAGLDAGKAVRVLYGGMDSAKRKAIRTAFNDPLDPVRILIATDAASEGLNLQETARYLLHYEIPWNPSRLEQRNGRLDRHGQPRDVTVFHFTSDVDADLKFLGRVVQKVHQIREDLGSLGEIFDAAFQRRFIDLGDSDWTADELDKEVDRLKGKVEIPASRDPGRLKADTSRISRLRKDLDLSAETLRATLEVALGYDANTQGPHLEGPDKQGRFRLKPPSRWQALIDDSLRLPDDMGHGLAGAIPQVVFDPEWFIDDVQGRPVFRPRRDTVLLHLGHPVLRYALSNFARLRFPNDSTTRETASRWTVRRGGVPAGHDAIVALTLEELAVNSLREPFHHWVRTVLLPVKNGSLGPPLPYQAPADTPTPSTGLEKDDPKKAREVWGEVEVDVKDFVSERQELLHHRIAEGLDASRASALQLAMTNMDLRIEEVRKSLHKKEIDKVKKERDQILRDRAQGKLFSQDVRELEQRLASVEEELERRESHARELLTLLERERKRVVEHLIPQRFSLTGGGVQVLPLSVEIRLPEVSR
ncbi:MAG: DISARM system SNF2-like helicase DrmD [Myxococcaceae bacterium]|nr:DISARM system SNF2-like helicase DrmD [Myxococcaceae bacterium]